MLLFSIVIYVTNISGYSYIFRVSIQKVFVVKRNMANERLKEYARRNNVRLWELADKLGYKSDATMSRKLRFELDKKTSKHYRTLIDEIAAAKNAKYL